MLFKTDLVSIFTTRVLLFRNSTYIALLKSIKVPFMIDLLFERSPVFTFPFKFLYFDLKTYFVCHLHTSLLLCLTPFWQDVHVTVLH